MFDPRRNVIHTADGRLAPKSSTSEADVRRIVREALAAGAASGIVLNFHGGLVSESAARETAEQRLYPLYADRGQAYPIFFIWESGLFEAPFNNLREIAGESLFQEFVKKVGEWVARHLGSGVTAARVGNGAESPAQLRADLDAWFRAGNARRKLPARLKHFRAIHKGPRGLALAMAKPAPDRDALAREIEAGIRRDARFKRAVETVHAGLHPQHRALRMARSGGTRVASNSLIDKEAAARLFPLGRKTTRGFAVSGWLRVAKMVAEIVLRVLRRVRTGRDHGKYVTLVEEVLRELYIGKVGRTVWWDRMKGDTADAFKAGAEYGGTVFLTELHDRLQGASAPRITLVGHSTGAIYIANFLRAAAQWVPDVRFDLILEAPAATHDFFARVIEEHGSRIANVRVFGMGDAREADDVLVPVIYPASLLYFVSGLLEDEPDQPLLGMERYLANATYDAADFPNVDACRRFFAGFADAWIWSPSARPAPLGSDGKHHQDFDDADAATLASVESILLHGY